MNPDFDMGVLVPIVVCVSLCFMCASRSQIASPGMSWPCPGHVPCQFLLPVRKFFEAGGLSRIVRATPLHPTKSHGIHRNPLRLWMFDDGFEYGNPEIPQMDQVEKVSEYIRVNIQGLPSVAFGMSALNTSAHEMAHIRV